MSYLNVMLTFRKKIFYNTMLKYLNMKLKHEFSVVFATRDGLSFFCEVLKSFYLMFLPALHTNNCLLNSEIVGYVDIKSVPQY